MGPGWQQESAAVAAGSGYKCEMVRGCKSQGTGEHRERALLGLASFLLLFLLLPLVPGLGRVAAFPRSGNGLSTALRSSSWAETALVLASPLLLELGPGFQWWRAPSDHQDGAGGRCAAGRAALGKELGWSVSTSRSSDVPVLSAVSWPRASQRPCRREKHGSCQVAGRSGGARRGAKVGRAERPTSHRCLAPLGEIWEVDVSRQRC